MDYISRTKALNAICDGCNLEFSDQPCEPCSCEIREHLIAVPAADVIERKKGEWSVEFFDDGLGAYKLYRCDQCGDLSAQRWSFCRECGADMRGKP